MVNNFFSALVPMKSNSTRLNNKNIKEINNIPLCQYILRTLAKVNWIDEIIVDTDSEVIAELSKIDPKVKIVWRSEHLRQDEITMNFLIEDNLKNIKNEFILQTHATNPLISLETIHHARDIFLKNLATHDSLCSANRYQGRFYDSFFRPINHNKNILSQSQDLDFIYQENSCLFLFTKESFKKNGGRIGSNPYFFITPKIESFDIDTKEDFDIVERIILSTP